MVIKAKAEITISRIVDIDHVTTYYLLQSSTAAAPTKPTANPPGGNWQTTEPSYTSGSTNTLYFVDLTVMTNGSYSYSAVSKSSSYEAAKVAYNKAQNAQNTADSKPDMSDIKDYVSSRGENLVTNGTCLLRNNTNFSAFVYDGIETYYAGGSFRFDGINGAPTCDEYIPVDTSSKYLFSYWIKNNNKDAKYYDMVTMYDIDKFIISAYNVMFIAGSTTKLAKDLKNGDTVVYLEDASGFKPNLLNVWNRGLTFWNYKNSKGYAYGKETYSRYTWHDLWDDETAIDTTTNTIKLKKAWSHGTFPAGTDVSQRGDGANYTYLNSNYTINADTWTRKKGTISGLGKNNAAGKFREGTAFVRVGWLLNRDVTSCKCWISTISFTQNPGIKDVDEAAKVASNYMKYDSTNGLVVGNVTAKTLGQNVQIGNSVVNIRNGSTILAQYGADTIYLGKNSKDSKIDLCNGSATIYSSVSDTGNIRTFNIETGDNCDIHTETTVSKETANSHLELRSLAYDGSKYASYHWGLTGSDPYGSSQISGEGGVIWAYASGGTGSAEMRINGQTSAIDLTGKTTINNSAGTSSTVINGGEISSASLTASGTIIGKNVKTSAGTSLDALATAAKYTYSVSGISITVWESPLMIRIKMSGTATAILATSNGYLSFGGIKATGMTPAIKKIWIQNNYEVSFRVNATSGKIELGYSAKNGAMVDIPSGIAINIDETFLLV